jgi:hypothetical protein
MKAVRFFLSMVLLGLPVAAFPQASAHNHDSQPQPSPAVPAAQQAFSVMKSLAGEWEGAVKTDMPIAAATMDVVPMHVTMRVTSRGNVMVHEFQQANTPLDPGKYDHPVTMLYVDSDQLNLVHYCDAGNRPHMTGKMSADGKKVEFDFADLSGSAKYGHMHMAAFTIIDENRHSEDWTFVLPSGKVVHANFDLRRVK